MDVLRAALASSVAGVLGLLLIARAEAAPTKVTICHKGEEISISEKAADAHLRNHVGDSLGACQEEVICPCWTDADLREAVVEATADPDVGISLCGVIVFPDEELEGFIDFVKPTGEELRVATVFLYGDDLAVCSIRGAGVDVGLGEILVEDLSAEEAGACVRPIAPICADLLP